MKAMTLLEQWNARFWAWIGQGNLSLISQGFWYRLIASLGVSILMPI